jgi:hypothetical protein
MSTRDCTLALLSSDDFDLDLAASLLRGVKQRYGVTDEHFIRQSGAILKPMRLWRFMRGERRGTISEVMPFLPVIERYTDISFDLIVGFLRRRCEHLKLLELASVRHWHPTDADMAQLANEVTAALSAGEQWIFAGQQLPLWLLPVAPRVRLTRKVLCDLGVMGRSAIQSWHAFNRKVHVAFVPRLAVPSKGTVLAFQSTFRENMRARPAPSAFGREHVCEVAASLAFHLVLDRGVLFGLVNDSPDRLPAGLRSELGGVDALLAIGDRFVLKRETNSPIWITCERSADASQNGYLVRQLRILDQMRSRVTHALDVPTSFGLLLQRFHRPY